MATILLSFTRLGFLFFVFLIFAYTWVILWANGVSSHVLFLIHLLVKTQFEIITLEVKNRESMHGIEAIWFVFPLFFFFLKFECFDYFNWLELEFWIFMTSFWSGVWCISFSMIIEVYVFGVWIFLLFSGYWLCISDNVIHYSV